MTDTNTDNPAVADPATSPIAAPSMPEGLDPRYWDASTGLKTPDLIKDFSSAQQRLSEYDARFAARPEKPDLYEAKLPEEFTKSLPEGVEIKFDPKDPVRGPILQEAQALAHELGIDQTTFSRMLALQAKLEFNSRIAEQRAEAETLKAEKAKLGERADQRLSAVANYLKANLTGAEVEALAPALTNASAVLAIEKLIEKATAGGIPPKTEDVQQPPAQPRIADRWYDPQQKAG